MKEVSRPRAKFQILILQSKPVLMTRVESAVTANTRPVLAPVRSFRSFPVVLSHIYYQRCFARAYLVSPPEHSFAPIYSRYDVEWSG
jgi:hypothetical protein